MAQVLVITNKGKAMFADRVRTSPGTYTTSPKFVAQGVGATGASHDATATDTAFQSEVDTRSSGAESAVTTTVTGDTYQVIGSITAGSARTVDEVGLFDAVSTGNMFVYGTLRSVTIALASGDALQQTWQVKQS